MGEIRDPAGLRATEQNLHVLCQQLREELRDGGVRPHRGWRLALLAAAAILLLLIGGVAGGDNRPRRPPDDEQAVLEGAETRLAVQTEGAGSVTGAPPAFAAQTAASVRSRVRPASSSRPGPWATRPSLAGAAAGATARCELRLAGDTTVTAKFTEAPPGAVTLRIEPPSNGLVTSDPAGIGCPQTCEHTFASGTQVVLTASAAEVFASAGGAATVREAAGAS
jgi:hypothetical protein